MVFFYVSGLEIGSEYSVAEFHHEDEKLADSFKWVKMNVTLDDVNSGFFEKLTVYKITQECFDRDGGTTLRMNVTFTASGCDPLPINWYKVCGEPTLTREGLSIGFSPASKELVKDGVPQLAFDGNLAEDFTVISSDVDVSTIYVKMNDAFSRTFYRSPYILSDHEVIYPVLTGSGAAGGWIDNTPKELTITYNCLEEKGEKTELVLVVELPYFHDIEIHFLKQCGTRNIYSAPKKAKGISWSSFFFILLVLGFCGGVGYYYYKYKKGESEFGLGPVIDKIQDSIDWVKAKMQNRSYASGPYDKDLPDFEDDGKVGLNVHSQYGTI